MSEVNFRDESGRWQDGAEFDYYRGAAVIDAAGELGIDAETAAALARGFFRHYYGYLRRAGRLEIDPRDGLPFDGHPVSSPGYQPEPAAVDAALTVEPASVDARLAVAPVIAA